MAEIDRCLWFDSFKTAGFLIKIATIGEMFDPEQGNLAETTLSIATHVLFIRTADPLARKRMLKPLISELTQHDPNKRDFANGFFKVPFSLSFQLIPEHYH